MKALRAKNIVHRDLKPGNILIKHHPTTGKMMVRTLHVLIIAAIIVIVVVLVFLDQVG